MEPGIYRTTLFARRSRFVLFPMVIYGTDPIPKKGLSDWFWEGIF